MLKNRGLLLLLALLVGVSAAPMAPAQNTAIFVDAAPPPLQAERVPLPRRGYTWAPGYWSWDGHRHVWVAGTWVRVRHGQFYTPAHWDQASSGWHFIPAHWDATQ